MSLIPVHRRGLTALGVVAALAVGAAPTAAVAASGRPVASHGSLTQRPAASGGTHSVTLITGDKVTIGTAADGTPVQSVRGPKGTATRYVRTVVDGATYVYPDAVLPYVSKGILDDQLFNVTKLIADGYDDAHTDRLPLIVRYTDAAARSRVKATMAGATVVRPLGSVQGAAVGEKRAQAAGFWSSVTAAPAGARRGSAAPVFAGGIAKIWLDGKVHADLAESTAQIGAPKVWQDGDTGQGVNVAILDTGVDPDHPDLAGQLGDTSSFVPYEPEIIDYNGHGTHTASTIVGTGAASDGKEKGVAPGARLDVGKVLDAEGTGQDSWIIAGMEWAAQQEHAKVISMSLGGGSTDGTDPMSEAVNRLSADTGALFVIAAGNGGPHSIGAPGAADSALTVGAVDSNDQLAGFSSQGPRAGDGGLKPEITAPGVGIVAARSHFVRGSGYYTTMSGTSMATPHVAGAAALLAEAHPDWTGQQLKQALVSSVKPTPAYTPYQAGAGRVDAYAAVHATVFATVSAYSGFYPWPQKPGQTDVKQVTYTNVGDEAVTLDLKIDAAAAPAGLFTLSADQVTVPAHGTGTVTLTADLDRLPVDQQVSGMINATDGTGAVRAHTLIGAGKEGQRQNLTIVAKDRAGKPLSCPAAAYRCQVILASKGRFAVMQLGESGTGTIRLPAASWNGWLEAQVQGANGPHSRGMAMLAFNDVMLDQDRTVTLDASAAHRVAAYVPQRTTPSEVRLDIARSFGTPGTQGYSSVDSAVLPNDSYDSVWALPTGPKVTDGDFEFGDRFRLEQPALTVRSASRAYDDIRVKRAATPLPAGTGRLAAVFAGDGSATALAGLDVRGKAAVVRRSDGVTIADQAKNAAAAGAKLLLVVADGVGRLDPWDETPWSPASPAPVTVATLTADEGAQLIDALSHGSVPLTVTSNPTTDYLYDVVHHWNGTVPANPTFRSAPRDLARIDVSFRNFRQGKALEYRSDVWRGSADGNMVTAPAQGDRVDWVTGDATWFDDASIVGETDQHLIDTARYAAGSVSRVHWFGPIQRPRMGLGQYLPARAADTMYLPAPGWGDSGAGHVGDSLDNFAVKDYEALYQGDRLLNWGNAEYMSVPGLAAQSLPYRLVVDNDRGSWGAPYSTHTLTEWNFTSAVTAADTLQSLPLIQLDYAVDTDKQGRAHRHTPLAVTPSQLSGVTAAVQPPTLEVSYDDGATWQRLPLTHHRDGWRAMLQAPRSAAFVSLRATAKDSAGDTVSQTITRAFGLR